MLQRRSLPRVAIAVCIMLGIIACGSSGVPSGSSAPQQKIPPLSGKVNVGVATDLSGIATLDTERGIRAGFDIDLVRWLGRNTAPAGFDPTFVDTLIRDRVPALTSGRVRLVAEAFSITDEKQQSIDFAGPYLITQQGAMVRTGDQRITDVNSLVGKTVCAPAGSTSVDQLPQFLRDQIFLRQEPGVGICARLLAEGQIDVVSTDQLVLSGFAGKNPGLSVVPGLKFGAQERYGVGLPNGDRDTCARISDALTDFIASGAWNQFFNENFPGLTASEYKPDPYALNTCA